MTSLLLACVLAVLAIYPVMVIVRILNDSPAKEAAKIKEGLRRLAQSDISLKGENGQELAPAVAHYQAMELQLASTRSHFADNAPDWERLLAVLDQTDRTEEAALAVVRILFPRNTAVPRELHGRGRETRP